MYGNQPEQNREIGKLMQEFVLQMVDFYDHLSSYPVCPEMRPETLGRLENAPIPTHGRPIREVYEEMLRDVYAHTLLGQHPRSFGCVPSTASLLSWMGDAMTSAYNPHASCRINAPAADQMEKRLIRWLCDLAGYPEESGGLFVSGGSMANLTALTAARDTQLSFEDRSRAVIYVSDQTHSSVSKGLHILGFRAEQIHILQADARFRLDPAALKKAVIQDLAAGRKPFAVVASAGTTNTGSVDPLTEIAALCREYGLWMHVDGAFGASALLSPLHRKELAGIELSDSLSWDAHKWMLQTYSCSMVLVRNQAVLPHSFAAHPEYLKDAAASPESAEFWDLGPELTRPARGLKLWMTLQVMGSQAIGEVIDHGCAMSELAEKRLRQCPGWEIVSPAQLGIVNFRCVPQGVSDSQALDALNQSLAQEITASGYAQIFTTELNGKKVLRLCTIHPETTEEDICETIDRLTHSQILGERYQNKAS